ncbi:hypothetical protein RRG08_004056 [Elysia crispata]|uniref:Uncharacterized protein n=1 Tax=Elysia crispata TaxID=231223 RepID=A0AAE0XZ43_9GAST|nr:hypothetical protein RRG08_004056 [Elysia crispata]
MDSYFQFSCSPGCMDGSSQWILGLCIAMNCPGSLLTRLLADKVGLKLTGVAAAIFLNASLFASAWAVQVSVVGTTVLLGAVMGVVQGVTSVVVFEYVHGWAADQSSLFVATSVGASTFLSLVQNQVVTFIVNPENLKPDATLGSRKFFSQKELLERVPTALITYAAMTLGLQFIGYVLLAQRPNALLPPLSFFNKSQENQNETVEISAKNDEMPPQRPLQKSRTQPNEHGHKNYGTKDVSTSTKNQRSSIENSFHSTLDITGVKTAYPTESEEQQKSMTPTETLKTPTFYAVFMFGIVTMYALLLKANFYKQFGLLYIPDDRFLTLVGTLIPVVAAASRMVLGAALSRCLVTIKVVLIFSLSVNSVLCSVWYFVPQINAVFYMFFILGLALVQSQFYVVAPVASLRIFGPGHFSTNYGLLMFSFVPVGILSPVVIPWLIVSLGWFWLFASASGLCLVTLLAVVCTDFNPSKAGL